jgi:hypothetical protein
MQLMWPAKACRTPMSLSGWLGRGEVGFTDDFADLRLAVLGSRLGLCSDGAG